MRLCDYCEVRPSAIVQLSIYVFVIFNITAFLANIQYISLLLSPIRRTRGQRIRRRCRAVDEQSSGRRIEDVAEQWTTHQTTSQSNLQQRDDRVCDNGASTSGGDHVFVRLIVRPHCRYGRETRLLGMERLWGRAAPEAAQCVHVASYIMLVHPTINPLFVRSFDSTAIRVGRAAQLLGADDDSRHHCVHGASYKCGVRGQHCCACGESCHHSCQCLTLYLTHRRGQRQNV